MKITYKLLILALIAILTGCSSDKPTSVSGVMYKDSEPANGTARIFNPTDMTPLAESKLTSDGKFFFKDVPQGEWLIGLTGRTGGVIGNYQYLKLSSSFPKNDLVYKITQEDPKAKALMEKSQGGSGDQ